jgi:outer membrane lipoprotein-sorting protein
VPATVTAVVAGGVAVTSAAAGGAPDVPARSPAQVLALAGTSSVESFSGTVRTKADLGLPDLSALSGLGGGATAGQDGGDPGSGSAADPQAILTRFLAGTTTLRVWADGPQRQRVQLLDQFAEVALVHSGRDVWAFDTGTSRGTHWVLPDGGAMKGAQAAPPAAGALTAATPEELAGQVLAKVDPTTSVTLDPAQTVAGRAAYTLVVAPRTDATLVDRAVLAVDAANGAALRVQVYARGHSDPVLETGFTDVDFARPAASRFAFTPPAGADVTTKTVPLPDAKALDGAHPDAAPPARGTLGDAVKVVGTGWATVVVATPPAGGTTPDGTALPDAADLLSNPMLAQLTTPVAGGRALRTALFSVLLTDDGRVLAGAVPVEALVAAAR